MVDVVKSVNFYVDEERKERAEKGEVTRSEGGVQEAS
jgi:hypothetical protein